jgi:hypothetical protein
MLAKLAIVGMIAAVGLPPSPNSVRGFPGRVAGKVVTLDLTEAALLKSPAWKQESPNPPLSAARAIQRATFACKRVASDLGEKDRKWQLQSVDLCLGIAERWYWVVWFDSKVGEPSDELPIVVLMDGNVLTPTAEPTKK